ncbi:MAG: hypothetical protein ACK4YP_01150, partial [Myxococcota bacterium]
NAREIAYLAPLIVLVFVMGVFPQPFLDRINPSVERFLSRREERDEGTPYAAVVAIPSWIGVTAAEAAPAHGAPAAPAHGAPASGHGAHGGEGHPPAPSNAHGE